MKNRAGSFISNLSGNLEYKSFNPNSLSSKIEIFYDEDIFLKLSNATFNLGILEGMSILIPNIDLFISMYIRKEALLSSQIEGTQASIYDILDPHIKKNTNLEVADVINYVKALNYSTSEAQHLPLSNRLIRETHKVLMQGLKGDNKSPGEFRTTQNWIGPVGSTIKTAKFVPPNPENLKFSMNELEKFIHENSHLEPLIKIALIHYQFETIHPFLDGNGRIGRLLINVLLKEYNLLTYDTLYISYYLKRNRIEYYDRLMEVRLKGDYEQWIKFFLDAVEKSSEEAVRTIKDLLNIQKKNLDLIQSNLGKSKTTVLKIFNYIEKHPIIDIKQTSEVLNMSFNTISNGVKELTKLNILNQVNNKSRYRVFMYTEYLDVLKRDTELL